jgi:hypothetical protein
MIRPSERTPQHLLHGRSLVAPITGRIWEDELAKAPHRLFDVWQERLRDGEDADPLVLRPLSVV